MLRKLEKYDIEEEIGHGGMATVYRAHDTVLDRRVALKVMHPHLRTAEEARQRFHREAQSVARLRHPRVLEIYDFSGEGSEEAYIAAELLTGPTLKRWREDHQDVPAEIAACFVIEIAKALEHAHDAKIIHRDVKPENVLLHEARTIKLTDFGIADMVDAASMTATGQILGSPGHMAPEQIEGKDTDTRTDLFSLGTVLYYLATGRLPFTGRNPHQILKRIVDSEYADPLRVNPTIGGRLRSIIIKSLARDPDDRYQTAAAFRLDLEAFVAEAGIDDVEGLLARYLKDPEGVGRELVERAIDLLIDRGARASDAGDVPTALDYYNRVLALDEGNERVLKLIERVGMDRRRRALLMAGAGLMALGSVAGGIAYYMFTLPPDLGPTDPTTIGPEPDAGARFVEAIDPTDDAGIADAGDQRVVDVGQDGGTGPAVPAIPRTTTTGSRIVRFLPEPNNVLLSVDGSPPEHWGAAPTRELTVGRHTVVVTPHPDIARSYRETSAAVRVLSGTGDQREALRLELQPASIFVICSAPGASVVVAGRARGTCDEVIRVPMQDLRENLRVEVGAERFRTSSELRQLEAGGDTVQLRVNLEPEGEIAHVP